ncbi:MAG: response regulator transcription factor [Deltaproteobacteria bacterium]|nr:response regulator transcription factor [Deltaproteobacteria bacterium]
MKKKVLIIDDDQKLQEILKEYLEEDEFHVISLLDGANCLPIIDLEAPDIVILDVMLPSGSGLDVMSKIKKKYVVPVIMLTAKGEDTDRIVGLELGADDYLPKPFNPRELVARMRAVMRRNVFTDGNAYSHHDDTPIKVENIILNRAKQTVFVGSKEIELTLTEFKILEVMMRNRDVILSRDRLMNLAMGKDFMAFDRVIDVHVSKLRSKLHAYPDSPHYIKTVRGTGYMFTVES